MSTAAAASFRDPGGRVLRFQSRILRALNTEGAQSLEKLLRSKAAQAFLAKGALVPTRFLDATETRSVLNGPEAAQLLADLECHSVVEHEPAPFASYAHEWAPEMLHAAGSLTLDLAEAFLDERFGLKDATPSNVMFWGNRPVFLDVLSFEERDPHDPTWLPCAQFARTFLLPLLANARFGIPLSQTFTTRRDGLEPEDVYRLLGPLQRLQPRTASLVTLPVWFGKRAGADQKIYSARRVKDPEQARFILRSLLRSQRRALNALRPAEGRQSVWSDYTTSNNNYSSQQMQAKVDFVRQAFAEIGPGQTLDVGCNTGQFSFIAAENGSRVVSVDYDPVVVGQVWRMAREKNAPVLPLVVNLAQPTPALGWRNSECRSFLDRAEGSFDTVMMLALIHHLLVTERVPLAEILHVARRLTRRWLIVEYIGKTDSMFVRLTRGRSHLHEDFTNEAFERAAQKHFRIVRRQPIPGGDRILYLLSCV